MSNKSERELELEALSKELNTKQRNFVHELERDGNQTAAAIRAGYSKKSAAQQGSSLLRNPKVAAYKKARDEIAYEALGMDENRVALNIVEVFNRSMEAKPHLSWDSGLKKWVPDGTWVFDGRTALRALELMGKNLGMFTDRVQVTGQGSLEKFLEKAETSGNEF